MDDRLIPTWWMNTGTLNPHNWTCGYCGDKVASKEGYFNAGGTHVAAEIFICPGCGWPTVVRDDECFPSARPGRSIEHVPADISRHYEEARSCMTTNSHTAVVLLCRVLLLRIAKDKEIPDKSPSYKACISHLATEGWIGAKDVEWVDKIRAFGNDANHELGETAREDALKALSFVEHLLASMYEYRGPQGEETTPSGGPIGVR